MNRFLNVLKNIILWIWQLPQNLIGFTISLFSHKNPYKGLSVYFNDHFFRSGVSLGNYIILDSAYLNYVGLENTIKHEHGHQIQSLYLGPLYLIVIGIPSICGNIYSKIFHKSSEWYYNQPWEHWADKLGKVER